MSKLGIEISGEPMDLPPGLAIELEKENPLVQFGNSLLGAFTFPFEVKNTNKNARLLNHAGVIQKKLDNSGIDAIVTDNGLPVLLGKIKIERTRPNLNKGSATGISCYLLSESADFYQQIKDMKLRDIGIGGDRSFDWEGLTTAGDGFWAHIHAVANAAVNAYDYAFFPVINKGWPAGELYPEVMNMMYYDMAQAHFPTNYVSVDLRELNRIVPMPYLHYVLRSAFEHVGWKLKGDILNDVYFRSICLINFRAIDWAYPTSAGAATYTPRNPVVFNLKDHLPHVTIAEFLIALKNRFGWWYQFDKGSKTVTIRYLKEVAIGEVKDITAHADPVPFKNVSQDRKIFALRNGTPKPDFTKVSFQGYVSQFDDLPTAEEAAFAHVYLLSSENNYYICELTDSGWDWVLFTANNFDYEPEGFNDEIVSATEIPTMEAYGTFDLSPRYDNMGEWFGRTDGESTWGIILTFFHGMRFNSTNDEAFPYASPHMYDAQGIKIADWGLSYQSYEPDGDDFGLYEMYWKQFLNLLNVWEEIEVIAHMPYTDYLNLKYENQIVLNGVKMFIKTVRAQIPYNKRVTLVCTRI